MESSRKKKYILASISLCLVLCTTPLYALPIFTDTFQSGNLDNWTEGGRQSYGTNTANVVNCGGSNLCGHLFHDSFTEITFHRDFAYDPADPGTFYFDMSTRLSSQPPPAPAYYGRAGVWFYFLDNAGTQMGSVSYIAATTDFIFGHSTSTRVFNKIPTGGFYHYELAVPDLLSQITIDESQISNVRMLLETYSSTAPYPYVSAELWLDDVSTVAPSDPPGPAVPEPATMFMVGTGILGTLVFSKIRKLR